MVAKHKIQIILILPNLQILIQMNLNQLIDIIIIKVFQKVRKITKDKQEDLKVNSSNNITINTKNPNTMEIISLSVKHQMLIQIQTSEIHKGKEFQLIIHLITTQKMNEPLQDNHKLHPRIIYNKINYKICRYQNYHHILANRAIQLTIESDQVNQID